MGICKYAGIHEARLLGAKEPLVSRKEGAQSLEGILSLTIEGFSVNDQGRAGSGEMS